MSISTTDHPLKIEATSTRLNNSMSVLYRNKTILQFTSCHGTGARTSPRILGQDNISQVSGRIKKYLAGNLFKKCLPQVLT